MAIDLLRANLIAIEKSSVEIPTNSKLL